MRHDHVAMYALARNWDIGDVRADVDYDHRSTPRRFTSPCTSTRRCHAERAERLAKVAEGCPVRRAIESGIVFEERVALDGRRTAPAAATGARGAA